jgi:hypothetical protein
MILRRPEDAICLSLYRDRNEGNCGGGDLRRIDAIKSPLANSVDGEFRNLNERSNRAVRRARVRARAHRTTVSLVQGRPTKPT